MSCCQCAPTSRPYITLCNHPAGVSTQLGPSPAIGFLPNLQVLEETPGNESEEISTDVTAISEMIDTLVLGGKETMQPAKVALPIITPHTLH